MRRYTKVIIFVVLAAVFIALAVQFTFYQPTRCVSFECFEEHMRECDAARYINDDSEATWLYEVTGTESGACLVDVTLLQAKTGELGIEKLVNFKMTCGYPRGVAAYPEKDLSACHGRLKEEMQGIIIEKLHTYIVDNIGELDETLDLLVEENS